MACLVETQFLLFTSPVLRTPLPTPLPQIFAEVSPGEGASDAQGLVALALWLRSNVHAVVVTLVLFAVVAHVRMASVALTAQDHRIGVYLASRGVTKPEAGLGAPGADVDKTKVVGDVDVHAAALPPSSKKDD